MFVALLFVSFLVFMAIGVPIAFALGLSSAVYLLATGQPLVQLSQKMYAGMDSFVLLSIPGFILAGSLMNNGGITAQIMNFSNKLVGPIRGGLAQANVVGSMVFAGISGTAVAEAASIGSVMIPGMRRMGYPPAFSAALTSIASTIGPIIPPSVPMIIVGSLAELSVGRMFLGGAIPGVLLGVSLMVTSYIIARKNNFPKGERSSIGEILRSAKGAFWAVMMTVIILFGITSGYFTPTEAAIVSVVYAFCVGLFVYRGFGVRDVPRIIFDAALGSASIILLVGFANVFASILTTERIPQLLADFILGISDNKFIVILLINILLLFVGAFMETIAALTILFIPLSYVATQIGMDPIHFAIMMILNLMLGLSTPPVGVCLFVTAGIAKVSLSEITRAVMPFLLTSLVVLMLVAYVPAITLWLPSLVAK